jgi:CubicO group peptidase (beta-lactamase class C family)
MTDFAGVRSAIEEGVRRGLHTGVQVYVSLQGKVLLDAGFGEAAPGQALTADHLMPWRSAGKPLTALLLLRELERSGTPLEATLGELLPAAAASDKSSLNLENLLTHTSGFPAVDTGWPQVDWRESVERVLAAPCSLPTGTAAYHPQSSWFLLGEVLRIRNGGALQFGELLERELLRPLGMERVYCGIPAGRIGGYAGLLPVLYEREQGRLVESVWSSVPWLTRCSPGSSLRGPVRELGRFMELMMRGGRLLDGTEYVSGATVSSMTLRRRVGAYDQTLQHVVDFGLGVICNSKRYGVDTVPYGFGRWSSEGSYGHGGSQCSLAMCDPERELVVAWAANGFCGEGQHQRRNRLMQDALYRDLGFADLES